VTFFLVLSPLRANKNENSKLEIQIALKVAADKEEQRSFL
jgi:hypothetical protein